MVQDVTQLMFAGVLVALGAVAASALTLAVVLGLHARSRAASAAPVQVRALMLERADRTVVVGAHLIAAAGQGRGVSLGSGADDDVPLKPAELQVRHVRLTREGGRLFLTNLGPAGSVAVADVPITPDRAWPLHAGDRIRLGTTDFVALVG